MPQRLVLPPDVLVLAAGGIVGEAWMTGVLAGLEDAARIDLRRCEAFVGTSAGSIVAASLVAGRRPRRPPASGRGRARDRSRRPDATARPSGLGARAARWYVGALGQASAPVVGAVVGNLEPGAAVGRAALLRGIPDGERRLDELREQVERSRARWDGRLRVCAVDKTSGRRVVFGAPGAPAASVGEAVAASCAVPWIFAPVAIGGRDYVDGGVWSPTNLDAAVTGRGTQVLCLNVAASLELARSSPFAALRAATRTGELVERLELERRGAQVTTIGPDAPSARALGGDLMDPSRREGALAAGYRQGFALVA